MQVVIRNQVLADKTIVAASHWARMRGLLGRRAILSGEGLLIGHAKAIHTIGLRFSIDVAFLDSNGRVVHMIHHMKPFRISPLVRASAMVLELPAGVLQRTGTVLGDYVQIG
jgi:uncharacterized membrane protein (UPF0127 family)